MSTPRIVSFAQPAGSAAAGGGRSTASSSAGKMGLLAIILLGINGIIGSGAFLLPQQIYHDAGFALGLAALLAAGDCDTGHRVLLRGPGWEGYRQRRCMAVLLHRLGPLHGIPSGDLCLVCRACHNLN